MKKRDMTIPQLKKRLKEMEHKELEDLLADLYKNNDYAYQKISIKLHGNIYTSKLEKEYEEKLDNLFWPKNFAKVGFSLAAVKKVISDFSKVCKDEELVMKLKLHYIECALNFTNCFGNINSRFYDTICTYFEDVATTASDEYELFYKYKKQIENIEEESNNIGWGVDMFVSNVYYNIPWVDDEFE